MGCLRRELEGRDSQLSSLREKGNSLSVAIADLKKQLTMREQELQLAKKEAKSTLRYIHCTMYIYNIYSLLGNCKFLSTCFSSRN